MFYKETDVWCKGNVTTMNALYFIGLKKWFGDADISWSDFVSLICSWRCSFRNIYMVLLIYIYNLYGSLQNWGSYRHLTSLPHSVSSLSGFGKFISLPQWSFDCYYQLRWSYVEYFSLNNICPSSLEFDWVTLLVKFLYFGHKCSSRNTTSQTCEM